LSRRLITRSAVGAKFGIMRLGSREMSQLAPTSIPLSIVYDAVENGWVQARIAELPGVITAAPTRGEARAMVLEILS
jgi:hypothetical protein